MSAQAKLSSRQRGFLLGRGYLVVRSLLDQAVLARIRDRLDGLVRVTVAAWANDPSLDTTEACVVADFDPADPGFAPCHQHPLLADAASLVLGDPWHVRSLDLRAPIPGAGEQGLHPDYAERRTEGPWQTLSAMWCVTPFTRDSGPLWVIPGPVALRHVQLHACGPPRPDGAFRPRLTDRLGLLRWIAVNDAGGGRRGTRATVSAELWEVLAAGWAIPRQRGRDLGGSLNLNLLVSRGDERLVVRVHRSSVSPARLEATQHARQQLDAAGVPCSALVVARDGVRWARAAGRLVEVERYIPYDGRMHTPPRLARGLPRLGRVHALLAGAEVSPAGRSVEFANHIEPGAVLSGTRAGTSWCTVTSGMTTSSSKARPWCLSRTSPSWPNGPASTTWP